jgi:xylulose-5-phosphate/fructose-6-phosphate phosphoketolase
VPNCKIFNQKDFIALPIIPMLRCDQISTKELIMIKTHHDHLEALKQYVAAADYLSASQIYLLNNTLLHNPLTANDIKPRLLGHWGTCPGINFIYAHLNNLINTTKSSMLFILGPGHGFAAIQANLFLEGTLQQFYPQATQTPEGITYLCKNFCWPYGFPSHVNPGTPGAILEGGELGYSLATAYGAVLDNPDLIAACVVGDGEAETGPTATAWHLNKFVNPKTNGVVLPLLHLNGYKISGPTIFGRMTNNTLKKLFTGYGYEPLIVEGPNHHEHMAHALHYAHEKIMEIKNSDKQEFHHLPMIIFKSPKGWGCPRSFKGIKLEGNNASHQVIFPEAKTNNAHLKILETWLRSYHFETLFDPQKGFTEAIKSLVPEPSLRMGTNKHAYSGKNYKPLTLPPAESIAEDATVPGTLGSSSMRRAGLYLKALCEANGSNKNFRFFSPDEIYSNKLDALLECSPRSFMLPLKSWDKDLAHDGRVIEMLSEHSLQGMCQGYCLTGRHAIFASYEAFIEIVDSMASQYAKFLKVAQEYPWRGTIPSFTYILTSSGWRQDHNGFSHQNPAFTGNMLEKYCGFIRAYFPPDGNSTLATLEYCLNRPNGINIIVAGKTFEPRWLTVEQARKGLETGIMTWDFASDPNPDIVFVGVGDYMTKESLAAIQLLKEWAPHVRTRFVNIMKLFGTGLCSTNTPLNHYFTADKPVIINYHGYPETFEAFLFHQTDPQRFTVFGYIEQGSTTTPFDMHVINNTSRYQLVIKAVEKLSKNNVLPQEQAQTIIDEFQTKLAEHKVYIKEHGIDPKDIEDWTWKQLKENL